MEYIIFRKVRRLMFSLENISANFTLKPSASIYLPPPHPSIPSTLQLLKDVLFRCWTHPYPLTPMVSNCVRLPVGYDAESVAFPPSIATSTGLMLKLLEDTLDFLWARFLFKPDGNFWQPIRLVYWGPCWALHLKYFSWSHGYVEKLTPARFPEGKTYLF